MTVYEQIIEILQKHKVTKRARLFLLMAAVIASEDENR
jgi:hypothetical protein